MKLDLRTTLFASVSVAIVTAVACSSYSGQAATPPADASVVDGANVVQDGATNDDATKSDGGAIDPCATAAPSTEFAGLYVIGGLAYGDGGAKTEPQDILRAPILCNGSLGDWATVGTLPTPNAGQPNDGRAQPILAAAGDSIFLFGGQTSLGGYAFSTLIFQWIIQPDHSLATALQIQGSPPATEIWRTQYAQIGSTVIVAGGETPLVDGGVTNAVSLISLPSGATFGTPSPLPASIARGGAASIGNDVYVFSGSNATVYQGTLDSKGTLQWVAAGTHNDADFAVASYGSTLYVTGGDNHPDELIAYEVQNKLLGPSTTYPLPAQVGNSCVAIARGVIYVIGGTSAPTTVYVGPLTGSNAGVFSTGPVLPDQRIFCGAIVVPVTQ